MMGLTSIKITDVDIVGFEICVLEIPKQYLTLPADEQQQYKF